jgi:hypothetical protein
MVTQHRTGKGTHPGLEEDDESWSKVSSSMGRPILSPRYLPMAKEAPSTLKALRPKRKDSSLIHIFPTPKSRASLSRAWRGVTLYWAKLL